MKYSSMNAQSVNEGCFYKFVSHVWSKNLSTFNYNAFVNVFIGRRMLPKNVLYQAEGSSFYKLFYPGVGTCFNCFVLMVFVFVSSV